MILTRTEIFDYTHGGLFYQGRRGIWTLGPMRLETCERWNIATRLEAGQIYDVMMAMWTSKSGKQARAFRILLTPRQFERIYPLARRRELIREVGEKAARGRMYFHPANHPHQLEGCIAPGLRPLELGVADSVKAMNEAFAVYGGWEEGKRIAGGLEVH
jgi:hypothetical protein